MSRRIINKLDEIKNAILPPTTTMKPTSARSRTVNCADGTYQPLLTITEAGTMLNYLFVGVHADLKTVFMIDDQKLEFPSFSGMLQPSALSTWGYDANSQGIQLLKNIAGLVVMQVTLPISWTRKLEVWVDNHTGVSDLCQLSVTYQVR